MISKHLLNDNFDPDKIPDEEIGACFHYEFARSSNIISAGIISWRKKVPKLTAIKTDWIDAPTSSWGAGNTKHSDPTEFEDYTTILEQNELADSKKPVELSNVDEAVLDFVASYEEFPLVSWQKIKNTPKKRRNIEEFTVPCPRSSATKTDTCIVDLTQKICDWEDQKMSVWKKIRDIEKEPKNALIRPDIRLFALAWSYGNAEITAAFGSWLETNRPEKFLEPEKNKRKIICQWQSLPVTKRKALEYLKLHRRKNTTNCSWQKFLRKWGSKAEQSAPDSSIRKFKKIHAQVVAIILAIESRQEFKPPV